MEQEKFDEILENLHCSVFHMNDEQAKEVIDRYLLTYPELLEVHDRDWFYKYC